jgi:hypothetical protein
MTEKKPPATAPTPPAGPSDAATVDQLRAENTVLRAQLAAAGRVPGATQPQHTFVLSEGQRQELLTNGVTNVGGVRRTTDEVRDLLGPDQQHVELGDTEPVDGLGTTSARSEIRGVDFVYPSVKPGGFDPAVAGTPGINGPSADTKDAE